MHPEFNRMEQVMMVLWYGDAHTLAACGRRAYVQDSAGRVRPSSPAPTKYLLSPSALADTLTDYDGKEKGDYPPQAVLVHCAARKEYLKSSKVSQWHKAIHRAIVQIFDRLLNSSNFSRLEAGQISGHRLHQFLGSKAHPAFDQSIKTHKRMQGSQNEDPDLNFLKNGECVSPDSNLRDEQQFIT
ncbi:hypothetical protein B0H17DRAFT_1134468 [Mycena rosella]|uniref:Uncharacterized protein n=1 Tax=Mycena rosella TaxID=1033263 RepID=A0AAD7DI95_MYCRO|nr:hypothetical protein B0H17DRAFT_1134468 [Mycena rosella]